MNAAADSAEIRLPYPHERNNCEMCRERDADVHVLGAEFNQPGKRPLLLCQQCLGVWAAVRAYHDRGAWDGAAVTIEITIAPERRAAARP